MAELFVPFALACLIFFAANRKTAGLVGIASAALLLARPALAPVFLGIKDIFSQTALDRFLSLATIPCNETLNAVAIFGMVLLIYRKRAELPVATVVLMLLLVTHNTYYIDATMLNGVTPGPTYSAVLDKLEASNITAIKTFEAMPLDYSGAVHIKYMWTIFSLQGYAMLHGYNLTFVDELNMPPQLSKGRSNIPASGLPQAIYERDAARCRNLTQELKAYGVSGILCVITTDLFSPPARYDKVFTNQSFLGGCGIENVFNVSDSSTSMFLYRLK